MPMELPAPPDASLTPEATVGDLAASLLAAAEAEQAYATDAASGDGQEPAGGDDAATAISSIFERVQSLATENEALRATLTEERATHLGLLEANRELEWRVRTGTAEGVPAGAARQEWEDTEAKLALLLAENNELESRERQTADELRRERETTAKLTASHAEALAAAQHAAGAAEAADAHAREEALEARAAADAAREAQALAAASDAALQNLRNELAAARAEATAAHREVAARKKDIERLHATIVSNAAEEEQRHSAARAARGELERRLAETQTNVQRVEAALAEARGQADGHALAAERMREQVELAQGEAQRYAKQADESARIEALARHRESELEEQVQALSRKLVGSSEALARQSSAAQRTAASSALAHAKALQAIKDELAREMSLATERELSLQRVVQELREGLEKEGRERTRLQHAYDAAVAQASLARSQTAESAAGGDVALREEALSAKRAAEESDLKVRVLQSQVKEARDAAETSRLRAEGDAQKLERAEILSHRKLVLAEEARDLMTARLAASEQASQQAFLEAERMGERRRVEAEAVRKHAREEVEQMKEQVAALKQQLRDQAEAAGGLQSLLEAQQRVAEGYRAEATRTLHRLQELESNQAPLQQTLTSIRQEEASARRALALQLQQQQSRIEESLAQTRTESLSDVTKGLDELKGELRAARQREEEQQQALQAARLVVQA